MTVCRSLTSRVQYAGLRGLTAPDLADRSNNCRAPKSPGEAATCDPSGTYAPTDSVRCQTRRPRELPPRESNQVRRRVGVPWGCVAVVARRVRSKGDSVVSPTVQTPLLSAPCVLVFPSGVGVASNFLRTRGGQTFVTPLDIRTFYGLCDSASMSVFPSVSVKYRPR
jgi:hypothetical protein